ncbi:MAG: alpha/beta hydrolase [Myxococcales bacterium]|nr:alpha/beta hydrolase [Myxococcales bacterium]
MVSALPKWLKAHQALYPFEPQSVVVQGGHKLSYVDLVPKGDEHIVPTVMIHGNPTWSFYYRNLLKAVQASGGRALALDHIGCGISDKPSDQHYHYTLAQRVEDLEEWFELVGLASQKVNLVVHDWGGMIGMAYASRHPEQINRLVVLNTAAFHIPGDKRLPFTLWLGRNTFVGQVLIQGFNAFSGLATRWACMKPLSRAVARAYTAPYHSWSSRIATHRFVKDIPLKSSDQAYAIVQETQAQLKCFEDRPILLAWGLKDFVFDETFLRVWQKRFPQAESHVYPDSGHYILEDEAEDLIPKIISFLSK